MRIFAFITVSALLFSTACLGLKSDPPVIDHYMIKPTREAAPAPVSSNERLIVKPFTAGPGYGERNFLVDRGGRLLERDYYNRFLVEPTDNFRWATATWLEASGLFAGVDTPGTPESKAYLLHGNLRRLEANYTDTSEAIVEMRFFLLVPRDGFEGVLLQKTYFRNVPLEDKTAKDLVAGWETGFASILSELETDLAGIVEKPAN